MLRRLPDVNREIISFSFDGQTVGAMRGDSVATALLAAGLTVCRTTAISGAPRAPYCLMGICFECLVTIDGMTSRQACLTPVTDGMRVETQRGAVPYARGDQ
jgi:sarcosine oxidase subunit alpha